MKKLGIILLSALAAVHSFSQPACDPPPSGIIAWWPGQGNGDDLVGGNNASVPAGVTYSNSEVGLGFSFDGNEFLTVSNLAPFNNLTNSFTVECWACTRGHSVPQTWTQELVTKDAECGGYRQFQLAVGDSHVQSGAPDFRASIWLPSGLVALDGATVVQTNTWYHTAMTYDGTTLKLYVNGVLDGQVTAVGATTATTEPVRLGGGADECAPYNLNGLLDEPAIYNRPLSSNEIAAIYQAGGAGKCQSTLTAPIITAQPASESVSAGCTATFSVAATGTMPLYYQWSLNQTNLIGATNATLALSNIQAWQAGNYSVLVSNFVGSTNSAVAVLTVNLPPSCDPPPSGIIAWWPGQGNGDDLVGGNNASVPAGVTYSNSEVGLGFSFDGNEFLTVSNLAPFNNLTNSFTVECWACTRGHSVPQTWTQELVTKDAECGGYRQFQLAVGDSHVQSGAPDFRASIWLPSGLVALDGATVVQTNTWYHTAMTYDGTTLKLYVNGVLDGQVTAVGATTATTEPVRLGGGADECAPYNLNGLLDEPAIYNRPLSSNEIAAIYQAGSAGKCQSAPMAPIITSFTPGAAALNATITITGINFSSTPAANIVYFGGVKAQILTASLTQLTVSVPAGTSYAPITITVNGLTASSASFFLPTFAGGASLSTISLGAPTLLPAGNGPGALAVGDLDGDGKPDLVVVNSGDGTLDIYRNLGTSGSITNTTFAPPVLLTITNGAGNVGRPLLADLDGDGRLDILVGGYNVNHCYVFQNFSSPGSLTTNSFGPEVDISSGNTPFALAVTDLDGDGKPEIVTANQQDNDVAILKNNVTGGLITASSFAAPITFATGPSPWQIQIVDMDGDGRPDIVTVDQSSADHKASILRNLGTLGGITTNSFAPSVDLAGTDSSETMTVGDLDGDGKPDVIVGSYSDGTITVYRNTSSPGSLTTNSFAAPVVFNVGARVHQVALGDLDGDGKPDLAVVTELPSSLFLYKNLSTPGKFTNSSLGPQLNYASENNASGVVIADINGDGLPDVIFGNSYSTSVEIYPNVNPVAAPPVIISQPTNQTVAVGGTSSFKVTVTGASALSYQWFFNQTNRLTGATNATLTLANVQLTNSGSYSVVVTNYLGAATSSNALLTVLPPPVIASQPTNHTIIAGGTVSFAVTAVGSPPLSYQWFFNRTALAGATNATLTLANVQPTNAGSYFVTVSNPVGSVNSSNALLAVQVPPSIVSQPASQTNTVGDTISFTVVAAGTAPLSYQWSLNQTNLLGATNATLVLPFVQPGQAGSYSVLISNVAGSTNSAIAVLTVTPAPPVPAITSFTPGAAALNATVTITGTNFSSTPAANIVYFGGVRAQVLTASPATLTVSVPAGTAYAPITVTVNGLTASSVSYFLPTFAGGANLSTISLGAPTLLPAGNGPGALAVGDLDGDGKPDLVVVNSGDGTLDIYRNLGTSGSITNTTFAPPVLLTITNGAGNVGRPLLADLDGDGRLDILVGGYNVNHCYVFQNFSSPGSLTTNSFGPEVDISSGNTPFALAVADLDGDGKPEIVTANQQDNDVAILKNNVTGGLITASSFAAPVDFATGPAPWQIQIVDMDGDGRPDIVTVDQSSADHKASILRNLGTLGGITTNSFAPSVDLAGTDSSETMTVGDLDGDGKPDVIVGSYSDGTITVYRNTSSPGDLTTNTFAAPVIFNVGARVHNVALGDLDGDGKPDLAVVTEVPSGLILYQNLSTPGSFTDSSLGPQLNYASENNASGVVIADINGDGLPDVIFGNSYSASVEIYPNVTPIATAPAITSQPTNQTVVLGGTASFSVAVTGTIVMNYQWSFEGTNIIGATNATLSLSDVQLDQAGGYSVLVSDTIGSTNSDSATLTVVLPPAITLQPQSQTVLSYSSASFTVAASGTGPLSYQWLENGTNLTDNGNIAGSLTTNLIITSVSLNTAGTYSVVVSSPYGVTNSQPAVLTVPETAVTMIATNTMSGSTIIVPVFMNALGVENTFWASVGYDPAKLVLQHVTTGPATADAYLTEVDRQTNNGYVGFALLLNTGETLPAGVQEVADLVFQTLPVTNTTTVNLTFGDNPTPRELVDNNLDLLPATYAGGSITLSPAEYEADVYPRTNGDHQVTVQDWLEEGRMVAGLDTPANPDEFLRADCAPRNAPDGVLTVADWVQAGRYALGLDPITLVTTPEPPASKARPNGGPLPSRVLSISTISAQRGQTVKLPIILICTTNENAVGLTANYNPSQLTLTGVSTGSALVGGRLNVNSNLLTGKVGIVLAMPPGSALPAGTNQVAVLQFVANADASGTCTVTLDGSVAVLQVADQYAEPLSSAYVNGGVALPPQPTMAAVGAGSGLQLSWPTNTGTFQVQTATSLLGPWTTINLPLVTNGPNATATVTPTNQQQYFRLLGQ